MRPWFPDGKGPRLTIKGTRKGMKRAGKGPKGKGKGKGKRSFLAMLMSMTQGGWSWEVGIPTAMPDFTADQETTIEFAVGSAELLDADTPDRQGRPIPLECLRPEAGISLKLMELRGHGCIYMFIVHSLIEHRF